MTPDQRLALKIVLDFVEEFAYEFEEQRSGEIPKEQWTDLEIAHHKLSSYLKANTKISYIYQRADPCQ